MPSGKVPPGSTTGSATVTSAAADPFVALVAVIVTRPAASAVSTGGSSVERLTIVGSLDVQLSPVSVCPLELNAWSVRVSPTTMFTMLGLSVKLLTGPPPGGKTVKPTALLHAPPCSTRATPVTALSATVATICVSLQLEIDPAAVLPSQTTPLPWVAPKPVPVIVMEASVAPEFGVTLEMCSVFTVNATGLLITPPCKTSAFPDAAPGPTWATIWPSLQACTAGNASVALRS